MTLKVKPGAEPAERRCGAASGPANGAVPGQHDAVRGRRHDLRRRPAGQFRAVDLATGKRLWTTFEPVIGKEEEETFKGAGSGTAFVVKNGDRFFLFAETGDLIIAKLTPQGYEEMSRAKMLEPTGDGVRPEGGVEPPGVRRQVRLRPQRQGDRLLLAGEGVTGLRVIVGRRGVPASVRTAGRYAPRSPKTTHVAVRHVVASIPSRGTVFPSRLAPPSLPPGGRSHAHPARQPAPLLRRRHPPRNPRRRRPHAARQRVHPAEPARGRGPQARRPPGPGRRRTSSCCTCSAGPPRRTCGT